MSGRTRQSRSESTGSVTSSDRQGAAAASLRAQLVLEINAYISARNQPLVHLSITQGFELQRTGFLGGRGMTPDEFGMRIRPSRAQGESDPGHAVVAYLDQTGSPAFRGFRFNPTDLPEEFQESSRWRDYLFDHDVPGYIVDEIAFLSDYFAAPEMFAGRDWPVVDFEALKVIQELVVPCVHGRYSFNPDDFTGCDNCVTWACRNVQNVAGVTAISIPRQGRVKLLLTIIAEEGK